VAASFGSPPFFMTRLSHALPGNTATDALKIQHAARFIWSAVVWHLTSKTAFTPAFLASSCIADRQAIVDVFDGQRRLVLA
jgi:hypothetical protein